MEGDCQAMIRRGWIPVALLSGVIVVNASSVPQPIDTLREQVLDSGTLAISSGPVKDPDGNIIGTFNSIWRCRSDGSRRIVFDKGC